MKTDIVIIGAGPAGIFTAIELIKKGSKQHIVIVEKGKAIEEALPERKDEEMRQLQAVLSYNDRFFGRGRIFRRKIEPQLRSRRRSAVFDR